MQKPNVFLYKWALIFLSEGARLFLPAEGTTLELLFLRCTEREGNRMRRKRFFGIVSGVLVLMAVMLLAGDASAQRRYKTLYTFTGSPDGNGPWDGLVFDAAGNLYGTTNEGGADNAGTVFELSPTSAGGWTESVLYSFTGGADGAEPQAGLILDSVGNLYGTASSGGAYGVGVVFELTPTLTGDWTESVLHTFTGGADGANPFASLIFDAAGNLYGTAWHGGNLACNAPYGCGVVFEMTPNADGSWTESVLDAFVGGSDTRSSDASLIFDSAGNLYDTTWYGGSYSSGTVFELSPNSDGTWTQNILYNFKGGADGAHPRAALIFDSAGNLYGTTGNEYTSGYGTVFQLIPSSSGAWTKRTLHQFTGKDGANPYASLIFDSAGNLYGTTNGGGAYGYGVIFELSEKSTGVLSYQVFPFNDAPGAYPRAPLILDRNGNLYGTTYGDGSETFGSVFEITP